MSVQQQQPGRPKWLTLVVDLVSFTLPWVLIFKQAGIFFPPPAQVNESILWLAGAMLGVPGVAQILSLRFGGSTASPASPEVPPGSPPSPSSAPGSEASA